VKSSVIETYSLAIGELLIYTFGTSFAPAGSAVDRRIAHKREAMKVFFSNDTYTSPPDTKGYFLDWLLFRSRWALYLKFAGVVFSARKKSRAGRYDDESWAESSFAILRIIERCGGKFDISGFDYVRALEKPVVFIANHMSTMETLILPVLIAPFRKVTYVVKEKLVKGPVFGPIMASRTPITVTRTDARKDLESVLTGGKALLEGGCSVIIFPQSTRREVFRKREFNTLGIKLALHAGVDVVPVAIKTDFWTNGRFLKGFGKLVRTRPIRFAFGPRITPNGRGRQEHQQTIDFIAGRLKSWGAEVEVDG
jgi:1-acyl-sn-glycerol-3-phosphate acyltransferase